MPNWTSNTLKAPAEVLKKYIGKNEYGEPCFDFNLVIKMPEIYNDPGLSCGFDTDWCIYWYLSDHGKYETAIKSIFNYSPDAKMKKYCKEHSIEYYNRGKKYVSAITKYGYKSWYGWSVDNWGTKWNACDSYFDDPDNPKWVSFETAWSYPEPIIKKIMADNPGCYIEFVWEDEDYNGTHTIKRHEDGTQEEYTVIDEHHYDED